MESPNPMDRLICGDVGFGKTEIAIRASFKAVMDNKQVAVLVPTTILAEQHYNTFHDRLTNWAVEVDHISRFRSQAEQKVILKRLREGKINIIIGTHRLLSEDVKFKDLGLLIIDEEQRFGVKDKEKIKMIKQNIDVLTLTATPIPRTLNFSLLGARDLSVINTPPKNRQPIHTEIINFDIKIISDAITREIQRGGQVYFVSDRITDLHELASLVRENVKSAKPVIAHGKMRSSELEKVMHGFLEKKTNVLVCTKIIESGLDIPSVNTIIINHAENFGLAELYQLRGRVGRSNIKSYAYLITAPHSSLTRQAIRRLQALEEFTELGSGMNLALRDMEIRGTGNLLGQEQSGFISELGFDMYMQILEEAVEEIKESDLGKSISEFIPSLKPQKEKPSDMLIETDIPSFIPDTYISDENTRLEVYTKISLVQTLDELSQIKEELNDRFGKIPEETLSLLSFAQVKLLLSGYNFSKLEVIEYSMKLYINYGDKTGLSNQTLQKLTPFLNNKFPLSSKVIQTKKNLIIDFILDKNSSRITQIISIADKLSELQGK
jgi:transcription-repair coupling factor (superfamily II helicase)